MTQDIAAGISLNQLTVANATISGAPITVSGSLTAESGIINVELLGPSLTLFKTTTGTVTLAGSNSFDGAVSIIEGTLVLGSPSALGSPTVGTSIAHGATLDLAGQIGVAEPLVNGGTIINSSGTPASIVGNITCSTGNIITVNGPGDMTLSGQLSGPKALGFYKRGLGTTTLSGANAFWLTSITGGVLSISTAENLGPSTTGSKGRIYIGGATLKITGDQLATLPHTFYLSNAFSMTNPAFGTIDIADPSHTCTLTGAADVNVASSPSLVTFTKSGAGTLVLASQFSWFREVFPAAPPPPTIELEIEGGTVKLSVGMDTTYFQRTVLLVNNGRLDLTGLHLPAAGLSSSAPNGTITTGDAAPCTLTVNTAADYSFTGTIAGPLSLTKTGNATQTLASTNTYTGPTLVTAGTLDITGSTNNTSALTIACGATARYNAGIAAPALSITNDGSLTLAAVSTIGQLQGSLPTPALYTGTTNISESADLACTLVRQATLSLATNAKLTLTESAPTLASGTPSGSDAMVSVVRSLSIANNAAGTYFATLDLTNNDLLLDYTGDSPLAEVELMLRSGFAGGSWGGKGITSSTAAANAGLYSLVAIDNAALAVPLATFDGIAIDPTTVIIKFSYVADIDGDGVVTPNDAIAFSNNYAEGASATHLLGDLNYNGAFDPNDAIAFANAYNEALAHLPEPASLALLAAGIPLLLLRRRLQG